MNTEQTAQQLELAAQILRTGHPWKSSPQAPDTDIYSALRDGFEIRPVLATPPDGRPLHNPDNLTAEQVGIGYRLTLPNEEPHESAEVFFTTGWDKRQLPIAYRHNMTYRLPLSVPWPEAPDPYAELKKAHAEGKVIQWYNGTSWIDHILPDNWEPIWIHPVKDLRIKPTPPFQLPPPPPGEPATKEVELGPEDVPPGSILTRPEESDSFAADEPGEWATIINVDMLYGCTVSGFRAGGIPSLYVISWEEMRKQGMKINRPRHRDSSGNPTLWFPCHKTIPQNG